MRRLFWLVAGVTVGVLVVRKVERMARAATPAGIGEGIAGAVDALRDLADAVREGMDAREQELRAALTGDVAEASPDSTSPRRRSH